MAEPTLLQIIKNVLAAFVGIRGKENRELDFSKGKATYYVIMGLILTVVFIFSLVFVVSKVISG